MEEVTEKLASRLVPKSQLTDDVLFSEETLGGYAVLTINSTSEYTKVNLEHLFIAAVLKPEATANLFAKSEMGNI